MSVRGMEFVLVFYGQGQGLYTYGQGKERTGDGCSSPWDPAAKVNALWGGPALFQIVLL